MEQQVLTEIEAIQRGMKKIERVEEHLEKMAEKEQNELKAIKKEEQLLEAEVFRIGRFAIKKTHLLEIIRGIGGAFLGVGLGQALGVSVKLAATLPMINVLGILLFVLLLSGILIYRYDKARIRQAKKSHLTYIFEKLILLYIIALFVQLLGLFLFNNFPGWDLVLLKTLIIGSFASMSSAVAFTLI